jgi:hypothetical protein
MFSSKIHFAMGVLLVTTLIGVGTWAVARPRSEGPPASVTAASPAQPMAAGRPTEREEGDAVDDRRRTRRMEEAQDNLAVTRRRMEELERNYMEHLIQARLDVQEAEENVRRHEAELAGAAGFVPPSEAIVKLRDEQRLAQQQLERVRAAVAKPDDPILRPLEEKMRALEEQVQSQWRQEQKAAKEAREKFTHELRKARINLYVAEEKLRQLRRREERDLAEGERELIAATERVQQAREGRGDEDRPQRREGRSAELEAKLDQLLRELSALRRELRRQSGEHRDRP